jgi:hypothetical protein
MLGEKDGVRKRQAAFCGAACAIQQNSGAKIGVPMIAWIRILRDATFR